MRHKVTCGTVVGRAAAAIILGVLSTLATLIPGLVRFDPTAYRASNSGSRASWGGVFDARFTTTAEAGGIQEALIYRLGWPSRCVVLVMERFTSFGRSPTPAGIQFASGRTRALGIQFLHRPPPGWQSRIRLDAWGFARAGVVWSGIWIAYPVGRVLLSKRWQLRGCCTRCGYSVEGLVQCPECGHRDVQALYW